MMCYATVIQSNPFIRTLRGPKKVSVLSGLNLEKMLRISFPQGRSKLSVKMTEVSVKWSLTPVLICTCSSLLVATEL